ncbi:hypothetical protein KUTeg_017295 [Tegillarca granosa]|uniref:Uncharacterized protein n=1 Tax=Tegillarca granosa TaxID=220873 RepID=A0ABQ9EP39_TEGGR|nr:hypothetical protein KUTeg_017295 [Tegillarca granosa]
MVNLLAVDQSVMLLGSNNDISESEEAGTLVLTDASAYDHVSYKYHSNLDSYPYKRSSNRLDRYRQLLARQAGCICPGSGGLPEPVTDKYGNPVVNPLTVLLWCKDNGVD